MSIRFSNDDSSVKIKTINLKDSSTSTSRTETLNTAWEFFKKNSGLLTDYISKQINIASTSFTPSLCLPTKELFSKILMAKEMFFQIKAKIEILARAFSNNETDTAKRKEYIKKCIANAYDRGVE